MDKNELIGKARRIIEEAALHRYSISSIYETHNAITGNNEKQQSCPTCLIGKVKEIRKWLMQADASGSASKGRATENPEQKAI